MYVGLCWRWRNIAKPTIASVQGKVIAQTHDATMFGSTLGPLLPERN